MHKALGSRLTQHCIKLGVVMHACESSILEVEAGVSEVQGQRWCSIRKGGRRREGAVLVSVGWSGDRVSSTVLASGIPFITLLQKDCHTDFGSKRSSTLLR